VVLVIRAQPTPERVDLLARAVQARTIEAITSRFALRLYKPNVGQLRFHQCPKRCRIEFGGNRTGKTEGGTVEAMWFVTGTHPFRMVLPSSGWVVSSTFEVQRDVVQEKFEKYLQGVSHTVFWRDKQRDYWDRVVIPTPNGSQTITFKSVDQGRLAFTGAAVSWIFLDEEVPMDIYTECLMRTMSHQGNMWGAMTPVTGVMYEYITEPAPGEADPEMWFDYLTWEDNAKYLPESERRRLLLAIPPEEREARIFGRFVPKSGRVYPQFNDRVHVIEPFGIPDTWKRYAGFDYGLRAATAVMWVTTDADSNVYFYDEHYAAEQEPPWHAERINARGRTLLVADPTVFNRADAFGGTVAGIYERYGVQLRPARRGGGSWKARTNLLRQLLRYEIDDAGIVVKQPRMFIFRDCCPNLCSELRKLRWRETRTVTVELPEDTQGPDHAIDAAGYSLEIPFAHLLPQPQAVVVKPWKPRNKYTGY